MNTPTSAKSAQAAEDLLLTAKELAQHIRSGIGRMSREDILVLPALADTIHHLAHAAAELDHPVGDLLETTSEAGDVPSKLREVLLRLKAREGGWWTPEQLRDLADALKLIGDAGLDYVKTIDGRPEKAPLYQGFGRLFLDKCVIERNIGDALLGARDEGSRDGVKPAVLGEYTTRIDEAGRVYKELLLLDAGPLRWQASDRSWRYNVGTDEFHVKPGDGRWVFLDARACQPARQPSAWGVVTESTDAIGPYADLAVSGLVQRFRWVDAGKFLMGSPLDEAGRCDDEMQREVTITKGFWMADTPVTQALYEAVMGNNPSQFKGATKPVETVSWDDAKAFVTKLNDLVPGLDARLPTEAEWEKACRAGTTGARYSDDLDSIAVYYGNSPNSTQPVKGKKPNAHGLYDMLGNVWEWVEDRFDAAGSSRVIRGGSWSSYAGVVRSARHASDPGDRGGVLGFRLSRGHQA